MQVFFRLKWAGLKVEVVQWVGGGWGGVSRISVVMGMHHHSDNK